MALSSLVEVDISNNNIEGQLAAWEYAHNELTGNLPSSVGNLSFLRVLNLMDNNLIGAIPHEVTRLGSLSNLWLSENKFTGGMNNFCDSATSPSSKSTFDTSTFMQIAQASLLLLLAPVCLVSRKALEMCSREKICNTVVNCAVSLIFSTVTFSSIQSCSIVNKKI